MKRYMLSSGEMSLIVQTKFLESSEWEKKEVSVSIQNLDCGMTVDYFYNKNKKFVIIPSPLAIANSRGDAIEPLYKTTVDAISRQIKTTFGLCCALLANEHYTTLYQEKGTNAQISIFDSKFTNPATFKNPSKETRFEKMFNYFISPLQKFFLWLIGRNKSQKISFLGQNATLYYLGTQPLLDGTSCGFYASGTILEIAASIEKNQSDTKTIVNLVHRHKKLDLVAEKIIKTMPHSQSSSEKSSKTTQSATTLQKKISKDKAYNKSLDSFPSATKKSNAQPRRPQLFMRQDLTEGTSLAQAERKNEQEGKSPSLNLFKGP